MNIAYTEMATLLVQLFNPSYYLVTDGIQKK